MKELIDQMFEILPEYIEDVYPKGVSKERGEAVTHIVLFLHWFKKQPK